MQRNTVALQVEKRCWPYYHPPQTLSRNKILLLQVEKKMLPVLPAFREVDLRLAEREYTHNYIYKTHLYRKRLKVSLQEVISHIYCI